MIRAMTNPTPPVTGPQEVDVRGRKISVKMLTDAQMLLLGRESRLARIPETDGERRLTAVSRIFDILESVILNPEDQEYCVNLAAKGELELKDMLGFMDAFMGGEEEPKVRRGRAPKRTQQ